MFFLDRYVHFSVFSHSITFSPIFNAVATYDTLFIKVVLPFHIKSFFYYLVKTLPHNRSYPSTTTTIPHRTTATYKAHRSTPISSILHSWYNTYLLKINQISCPIQPTASCDILQFYIHTNILPPEHIPLSNFNSFLKVCAFDETIILFACLFTSTVTYVPVEPNFKTMAAFASGTTPSFWTITPNEYIQYDTQFLKKNSRN